MREIKFRAWDKRLRIMSDVNVIEWNKIKPDIPIYVRGRITNKISKHLLERGEYQEWQTGGETETREAINTEDMILMQYTGLKDKNGKEIYEGDILKCTSPMVKILSGKKTGKISVTIYSIIWLPNQARFATKNPKRDREEPFALSQNRISDYYEVIGNIFENPELLEVKSAK